MTKEEAKEWLDTLHYDYNTCEETQDIAEAIRMAIQALEQQLCDNAISRDTAMMIVMGANNSTDAIRQIQDLPPVTPIRPKGEWKYDNTIQNWRCSKCNETPKTLGYVGTKEFMTEHFKFCNHCGADMRGKAE